MGTNKRRELLSHAEAAPRLRPTRRPLSGSGSGVSTARGLVAVHRAWQKSGERGKNALSEWRSQLVDFVDIDAVDALLVPITGFEPVKDASTYFLLQSYCAAVGERALEPLDGGRARRKRAAGNDDSVFNWLHTADHGLPDDFDASVDEAARRFRGSDDNPSPSALIVPRASAVVSPGTVQLVAGPARGGEYLGLQTTTDSGRDLQEIGTANPVVSGDQFPDSACRAKA